VPQGFALPLILEMLATAGNARPWNHFRSIGRQRYHQRFDSNKPLAGAAHRLYRLCDLLSRAGEQSPSSAAISHRWCCHSHCRGFAIRQPSYAEMQRHPLLP